MQEGVEARKDDVERNRRLDPDEEIRIRSVLCDHHDALAFFVLALESAMRLREMYTLDIAQVSLEKRTVHLDRSKNGDSRQVSLTGKKSTARIRWLK